MKILILHNTYQYRGGEDAIVEAEARLLNGQGATVDVKTVSNLDIRSGADKLRAGIYAASNPIQADRVGNLVADRKYDLVHIHNFFPQFSPAVHEAAHAKGAAVVQTLHNFRLMCANALFLRDGAVCEKCLAGSALWGAVHRCYRGSFLQSLAVIRMIEKAKRSGVWRNRVNRFIALTEFGRCKFIEGGLPADKIVVKPNFVEDPWNSDVRSQAGAGALYVGRLSSEKGADVLVRAWRALPDVPLRIAGDGPLREALVAVAPSNVTFLGILDPEQIRQEMEQAAVLILPSICYEGFPRTLVEAYRAGLPVLGSDLGAVAELLEHGATGWLFAPGNSDELAKAVRRAFSDADRLAEMGLAARRLYEQRYTPEINRKQLLKIYEDAVVDRRLDNAN